MIKRDTENLVEDILFDKTPGKLREEKKEFQQAVRYGLVSTTAEIQNQLY